jgi:hypothetical protein
MYFYKETMDEFTGQKKTAKEGLQDVQEIRKEFGDK